MHNDYVSVRLVGLRLDHMTNQETYTKFIRDHKRMTEN